MIRPDLARRFVMAALAITLASEALAGGQPSDLSAQELESQLLVTPEWVARHLNDNNLVLLHVGDAEEYAAEHIPGALLVSTRDLAAPRGQDSNDLQLEMPEPETLAETLGALGIRDDSRIVVYFGTDWVTPSARILFTLDWIGLGNRTSLLDGGMPAWKAAGEAVTGKATPPPTPAHLTPRVREGAVVSAEWVRDHLEQDGIQILDARAPDNYNGIEPSYLNREPVRKGRIPGAGNVYAMDVVGADLKLKPPEELRRIYREAGVEEGDLVVGYCHLGQYATLTLLGAKILGHPASLYDGSFQEWGSRPELPVEGPSGQDGRRP